MFGLILGAGLVVAGAVALVSHRHGIHRGAFHCAMRRLKANPEQRERLRELFDESRSRLGATKARAQALHGELADVVASPNADPQRLESLESRLFEVVGEGSHVMRDMVARVHEILDPQQRQQVADWLRRAPCHHHRHGHACC